MGYHLSPSPEGQYICLCPDCCSMECTVGLHPLILIIRYRWLCKSYYWRNRATHRTTTAFLALHTRDIPSPGRSTKQLRCSIKRHSAARAKWHAIKGRWETLRHCASLILGELQVNSASIRDKHGVRPGCCRWRAASVSSSASGRRFLQLHVGRLGKHHEGGKFWFRPSLSCANQHFGNYWRDTVEVISDLIHLFLRETCCISFAFFLSIFFNFDAWGWQLAIRKV